MKTLTWRSIRVRLIVTAAVEVNILTAGRNLWVQGGLYHQHTNRLYTATERRTTVFLQRRATSFLYFAWNRFVPVLIRLSVLAFLSFLNMTSVDDIRELLAQLVVNTVETQTQINALAAEARGLATNVRAAPGATPPVLVLQSATQIVRKSSETTVQLSLSDDQHTVEELDETVPTIRQLTLAVSNLAANVGAVPGAAPPVFSKLFENHMIDSIPYISTGW